MQKSLDQYTALMQAGSASMRFEGNHVSDRDISDAELARFKDVGQKTLFLRLGTEGIDYGPYHGHAE